MILIFKSVSRHPTDSFVCKITLEASIAKHLSIFSPSKVFFFVWLLMSLGLGAAQQLAALMTQFQAEATAKGQKPIHPT
jgi:hypothetical protein